MELLKKEITEGQRYECSSENYMSYNNSSTLQLIIGTIL